LSQGIGHTEMDFYRSKHFIHPSRRTLLDDVLKKMEICPEGFSDFRCSQKEVNVQTSRGIVKSPPNHARRSFLFSGAENNPVS
jgi:hypothetical protein